MVIISGQFLLSLFRAMNRTRRLERAAFLSFLALHLDPLGEVATGLEPGKTYVIYGMPWVLQEVNVVDLEGGLQLAEAIFVRELECGNVR